MFNIVCGELFRGARNRAFQLTHQKQICQGGSWGPWLGQNYRNFMFICASVIEGLCQYHAVLRPGRGQVSPNGLGI